MKYYIKLHQPAPEVDIPRSVCPVMTPSRTSILTVGNSFPDVICMLYAHLTPIKASGSI